ncbi:MAG: T9SS type A sorting domain-containing protein [Saprospiraceae bacterium]|nr:MAG: T9SS type A sorting domain-containing protein [Saprospiraceae bacterium]
MKNLRFPQHFFARSAMLAAVFALFGWALTAQTIGGTVHDECSGAPIGGATIHISVNIPGSPPGSWSFPTAPNGTWNFSFFGGDPNGPYIITVSEGAHAPGFYTYYRSEGSKKGLDFDLLPDVFDITINGEAVSSQNNPSNPHTVCQNAVNCVELVANGGVDEFEPNTDYCYKLYLYSTDASGNPGQLLAESACQNFSRPDPVNPCDPGFDLNALLHQAGQLPPVIRMEVRQFCCSSGCIPGEGTLVNTEVVFIEVSEIGPAQACFRFEDPNGVDLIEPGTDCENAVAYCQIDVEVDGTCSSGAIDHYWIEVSEYDINTCEFIRVLADGSSNPTTIGSLAELDGINLNNYVRDHWVADPNPQWPYFFLASNPPRNFEVTLFVENACGVYSQTGWFNNSIQCLTGGGSGQNNLSAPPTSNSGLAIIDGNIEILIYPNPVSDISNLRFQLREEEEVFIEVKNISGETLKKVEVGILPKGINEFSMDFSGLPSGSYTLTVRAGDEAKVVKIAKI